MDTPFDRRLRRIRRDRARFADADYLIRAASDELVERLDFVTRKFERALEVGSTGGYLAERLRERGMSVVTADTSSALAGRHGVQADEDRLPFEPASFDLVVSVGVLDSVNDLPGALLLIRRALRPDGLFLGAFAGAGSLPRLRSAMMAADSAEGGASPHIHPQIDVRAAGDLLTRAGFALPVVDSHEVTVRFPNLMALVADLRAMAGTNVLASRPRSLGKPGLVAALTDFADAADPDGKTSERFQIVHLLGWSPSPDQPQPARRGSATASLADVLGKRD
ncbi:MAG: methyltransferase domain-containing protein [Alphaproteobacteria bacterium]|nr:MAG: methyltransferase domain-containing protein [Alphaproteobacteria bacterium]